jgi:hypothetical protein
MKLPARVESKNNLKPQQEHPTENGEYLVASTTGAEDCFVLASWSCCFSFCIATII